MIAVSQKFRDSMADEQALALLEKQQREIVLPTNATRKMKAKLSVTQWSGPSPSYTETFPKLDPRLVKTVNVEKPAWISKTRSAVAREKRDRKSLHSGNVERSIIERERMRQQLSVDKEALARDFMVTRLQEIFDARAISAKDLALLKDFLALDYGRSLYIRLLKGQLKVGVRLTSRQLSTTYLPLTVCVDAALRRAARLYSGIDHGVRSLGRHFDAHAIRGTQECRL